MIDAKTFHGRGRVAVLRTRPETVLDDYYRLMQLCRYTENLPQTETTLLKLNLSWQIWYPACSTAPWQLDGVIRALLRDGYPRERLVTGIDNNTYMDDRQAAHNNRLALVQEHYGIRDLYASDSSIEWVEYRPTQPLAVLDRFYPDGIMIPRGFVGKNILHLPTVKTDAAALVSGALQNAFGALLDENRKRTRANLHDTLVDLLQIQQEISTGIFGVMDGTFAGEGPGPRTLRPHVKSTLLASSDLVALDAVAARIMGVDPMRLRYIRHAHERELGVGDPRAIEIIGDAQIAQENWHMDHDSNTLLSWSKRQLEEGSLAPVGAQVTRSPLATLPGTAAHIYHDFYWYPFVGAQRAEMMLNTAWGQKFLQYSEGLPFNPKAASKKPLLALTAAGLGLAAVIGLGAYYSSRRGNS